MAKETTLIGWSIGIYPAEMMDGTPGYRLGIVDGRASASGEMVPNSGSGDIIACALDLDGLKGLHRRITTLLAEAETATNTTVEIASAIPLSRADRRRLERAAK